MISFIKKYKYFIIAAVAIAAVLTAAFLSGGNVEKAKQEAEASKRAPASVASTVDSSEANDVNVAETATSPSMEKNVNETSSTVPGETNIQENTVPPATFSVVSKPEEKHNSEPASTASPGSENDASKTEAPTSATSPQNQKTSVKKTCKLSISCSTILDNMDKADEYIKDIIPSDGWILKPVTVTLRSGESVFDVLKRICKDKKIHMEFTETTAYNSAYIEGIGNIYEFDCGSNSGWMYCVNGIFPSYGCSQYEVKDGDTIEWKYTCNLGYDVGGGKE